MHTPRSLLVLLAAVFALLTLRPAPARAEVSFDFFYDSLAPHGEWLRIADYGYCWRPTEVGEEWTPYSDGYWAFTDAGWTWVSYEDFGGIVYHYGRWVRVEDEGWCWAPDYEWGPAWVSWRQSEEHVGWAPLPPEARWQPSIGISIWADQEYDIGPDYYNFCRVRDFGAPVLRPVLISRGQNVTIIRQTVNITNITYNTRYERPVIYNGGPDFESINRRSSRRVPALRLVQKVDGDFRGDHERRDGTDREKGDRKGRRGGDFNARAVGDQLIVSAPQVRPPVDSEEMRGRVKKVVAADKVTRGWSGVKNEEVRKELKQEISRQARGLKPDSAPARAVEAGELKAVPRRGEAVAGTEKKDERKEREKGEKPAATSEQSPKTPATTAETPEGRERMNREKGRGETTQEKKPGRGEPALAPFNPPAERGEKREKDAAVATTPEGAPATPRTSAEETGKKRESRRADEENAEVSQSKKAARASEDARRAQAEAEQERAARRRSEAAAMQRKQADGEARAAKESAREQAGERAREQEQSQARRQQQSMEQQRRQLQQAQEGRQQQGEEQRRQMQEAAKRQQQQAGEQQRRPPPPQKERDEQSGETKRGAPKATPGKGEERDRRD